MRELFQTFLAGDNAAFGAIYRELNPRLSAYCYKLAPNDWQDIVQELWEKIIALRTATNKVAIESPLSFMFQMARNLVVDRFRRRIETRELLETDSVQSDSPGTDERSDLTTVILESLERLPFDDREILVLNIYSGYSFAEIAAMQQRSTDAVWQQASRARKRLREFAVHDAKRLGIALPAMNSKVSEHLRVTERTTL